MNPYDDLDVQLTLVAGKDDLNTRFFTLTSAASMSVGRSSKTKTKDLSAARNNCNLNNPVISRDHATFTAEYKDLTKSHQLLVQDNGSMHGTLVNNAYIPKKETFPVHNGDYIQFGTTVYRGEETFEAPKYKVATYPHKHPRVSLPAETTMPAPSATLPQKSGFFVPDSSSSRASSVENICDIDSDDDDDLEVSSKSDSSAPPKPLSAKKHSRVASPEIMEAPSGSLEKPIEIDVVDAVPESVINITKKSIFIDDIDDEDEAMSESDDGKHSTSAHAPSEADLIEEPMEYPSSFSPFINDESDVDSEFGHSSPFVEAAGSSQGDLLAEDPIVASSKTLPSQQESTVDKLFQDPSLEAPVPTRKLKIGDMLNDKHESTPKISPVQGFTLEDITGGVPPAAVVGPNFRRMPFVPQPPRSLANPWVPRQNGIALPPPSITFPLSAPPPAKMSDGVFEGSMRDMLKPPPATSDVTSSKKRSFDAFALDNKPSFRRIKHTERVEAPAPVYSPIFGPDGKFNVDSKPSGAVEAVAPQSAAEPTREPPRKRSRLRTVAKTAATLAVGAAVGGAGTLFALVAMPENWF